MENRFTKIDTQGKPLPLEATEWVAVLDEQSGLMWDAGEGKSMDWKKALAHARKLAIGGFDDWRLPTVEELFLLADRTKFNPAIDTAYFPKCKGGWYWTSTVDASSPSDCAWLVLFYNGYASYYLQSGKGLVRAVRARQ